MGIPGKCKQERGRGRRPGEVGRSGQEALLGGSWPEAPPAGSVGAAPAPAQSQLTPRGQATAVVLCSRPTSPCRGEEVLGRPQHSPLQSESVRAGQGQVSPGDSGAYPGSSMHHSHRKEARPQPCLPRSPLPAALLLPPKRSWATGTGSWEPTCYTHLGPEVLLPLL